jgi:hypothetical protein
LHVEHPCSKLFVLKNKQKRQKPKVTPKILMPLRRQQNLARGMNLRGKPDGTQVELL